MESDVIDRKGGRLSGLFSRRDVILACLGGLLVGMSLSLGHAFYAASGNVDFKNPWLVGRALLVAIPVAAFILAFLVAWDAGFARLRERDEATGPLARFSHWPVESTPARRRLFFLLVISALWIPAFLAVFPGNYSSDAPTQVTLFLNKGLLDLRWPWAHTLFLSGCIEFGRVALGSTNVGLSIYCILQGMLLAFALSFASERLVRWGVPPLFVIVVDLVMVLNPVCQAYAFATTKDSLFAAFFLISFAYLVEFIRDPRGFSGDRMALVRFGLAVLAMCLMRKQGAYVFIAVALVLLIWSKGRGVWFLLTVVVALLCSLVLNSAVSALFTTRADLVREVLSVPSQQIVRTYMLDHDSLSSEQIKEIGRYYYLSDLETGRTTTSPWQAKGYGQFYDTRKSVGYLEPISDPAKEALKVDAYAADKLGYFQMWLSLAKGHEGLYLEAFLWGQVGYVYPSSVVVNRWTGLSPWNEYGLTIDRAGDDQISNFKDTSLLPGYYQWLRDGTWDMFPENPVLMFWVSPALPFYVLLVSFILIVRRRRNRMVLAWILPFVYWVSLSLGPVMCVRYVVPLFFCLPLIVCCALLHVEDAGAGAPLGGTSMADGDGQGAHLA